MPARISLGFRQDNRLSFTGLEENRSLVQSDDTIAIRDLLQELYVDAVPCGDPDMAKPLLGNHFQIRWTTQGGAKLRFYLKTTKKGQRPKFEVPTDDRVIRLRGMIEDAYAVALTDAQHAADEAARPVAKTAAEVEEADYVARLLAGEIVEPS